MVSYEEALAELVLLKDAWMDLHIQIDRDYNKPTKDVRIAMQTMKLQGQQKDLYLRIRNQWPEDSTERALLRPKMYETNAECESAMEAAKKVASILYGMQTKDQQTHTAKILGSMDMTPPARKMRLVVETTDKATPKTFKILKDTMFPAFKVPHEYKQGEYTVNLESE